MANDVEFAYRLPLTYVRVTGSCIKTTDELESEPKTGYKSVVTTETGADLLTSCHVRLSPASLASQKSTWNLTADGRLTGADVTTTVEPLAVWKTSLEAGAAVLAAGAPLAAAGPMGWVALAGAAGAAAIGTGIVAQYNLIESIEPFEGHREAAPEPAANENPRDWQVHAAYIADHPAAAQALANYRAALAKASAEHARAALGALSENSRTQYFWEERVKSLQRILASVSVGAGAAEAAYAQWRATKVTTEQTDFDVRLRIDDLPDGGTLTAWLERPTPTAEWHHLANDLRVAVSVELDDIPTDNERRQRIDFVPQSSDEIVHYRQPRSAVLTVWELTPAPGKSYTKKQIDVRRIFVAYPGNEARISIASAQDTSNAVSVGFDESGALIKVTADLTDRTLQRAHDISALLPALSTAATAGTDLRKAFSPPSLVDRAAEAKAARELGLTPVEKNPLEEELAEQQLRAQLKIAQQIASSTSLPVMVSVQG